MQVVVKVSSNRNIIKAYHGSFSKISKFKTRKEYSEVEVRFDRYIGPHFAADRKLAENVVKVHAIGLGIFYGAENKKAYIHEVTLKCDKIYDLQKIHARNPIGFSYGINGATAGLAGSNARGEGTGGGTAFVQVYESSLVEAGIPRL